MDSAFGSMYTTIIIEKPLKKVWYSNDDGCSRRFDIVIYHNIRGTLWSRVESKYRHILCNDDGIPDGDATANSKHRGLPLTMV